MKGFTAWRIEDSKAMALEVDCCIEVEVLQCAEGLYAVMDESCKRLYKTAATSYEEAVRCYINWCYGMTRLWKYDEAEGGYCESEELVAAATQYEIKEDRNTHWDVVEG